MGIYVYPMRKAEITDIHNQNLHLQNILEQTKGAWSEDWDNVQQNK